jgi:deoxycytidylate deaminase
MNPIKLAIKQAEKSTHNYRLGAVITKGRRVLGQGCNDAQRFQSKVRHTSWPESRHAEVAAVMDALRRYPSDELKGSKITVVRINNQGQLRLAYPCESCYNVLSNIGVRRVIYSNNQGTFSEIRI